MKAADEAVICNNKVEKSNRVVLILSELSKSMIIKKTKNGSLFLNFKSKNMVVVTGSGISRITCWLPAYFS